MSENLVNLNFFKAKKLKKQLLLCYKIMQLEPYSNYINIIYSDSYQEERYKADRSLARKKGGFAIVVLSKQAIEYFLHEKNYGDNVTYKKFNSTREFLIYATNASVFRYATWHCYHSSKEKNIDPNTVGGVAYGNFMRECREEVEKMFVERRESFFKSKNFKELIASNATNLV